MAFNLEYHKYNITEILYTSVGFNIYTACIYDAKVEKKH